jgi:plasmid replication initiation protein
MEHPLFSLSKSPDLNIRVYEHNGSSITITPSANGLATIWDKDVLLFAISSLVEAQTVAFLRAEMYDCALATCSCTAIAASTAQNLTDS